MKAANKVAAAAVAAEKAEIAAADATLEAVIKRRNNKTGVTISATNIVPVPLVPVDEDAVVEQEHAKA